MAWISWDQSTSVNQLILTGLIHENESIDLQRQDASQWRK